MQDKEQTKQVTVSVTIEIASDASSEELADRVGELVSPLSEQAIRVSDVAIRTVPKLQIPDLAAGYEHRLWEKATCWSPEGRLPGGENEFDEILEAVTRLASEAEQLGSRIHELRGRDRPA